MQNTVLIASIKHYWHFSINKLMVWTAIYWAQKCYKRGLCIAAPMHFVFQWWKGCISRTFGPWEFETAIVTFFLKFIYSEKATKFCEISTLILSTGHTDKSKVEILQNFVAFSEYMNFKKKEDKMHTLIKSVSSFFFLREIPYFLK